MEAKARNKKSIEVGGLGVFDEPEVGSVAREKSEVASEDKQDKTIGRSLEYIISVTGSFQWMSKQGNDGIWITFLKDHLGIPWWSSS